jgi:Tol biopolymer transport system component
MTRLAAVASVCAAGLICGFRLPPSRGASALRASAGQADGRQTGYDLFQRALTRERAEGQIEDAIRIYERIAREYPGDRALAAKALLQAGRCYERLGRTEARATYDRLLRDYADQRIVVDEARARLAVLARPGSQLDEAASTGPRARRLWEGQAAGQFLGSPSPDGRSISFVDWSTIELALWDVATGAQRPLTKGLGEKGAPYWSRISPDGAQVVFTFFTDDGLGDLRLVRLDDLSVRVLYRNDQIAYVQPFDWTRDGQRILVVLAMPDRTNRIAILSVADGSTRILKTLDWRQPSAMSFSPDGRWIAYDLPQDDSGRERDLYVLAADGTRETPLVAHAADDALLAWAPDGKTVLFATDRTGTPGAWSIEVAEGKPAGATRFVRGDIGWRVHPMGFSRSGAFFYFIATSISDVYTATLDPGAGRRDDTMTAVGGRYAGTYQSGDWSPDGRELALVVNRAGLPDRRLVVRPIAGGPERELRPDLAMFTWPRWAPDGRSLLVSGRDRKNRAGLFRVDAATGSVVELLRQEAGASLMLRAEWAPGGGSIYYARRDTECSCVLRRDLATGRDTEIDRMPPSGRLMLIAPSPDGRWVAVSTHDGREPLLKLIPAAGGEGRVLASGEPLRWFDFVAWTPDGREVLFGRAAGADERVEVWRAPIAGGAARPTGLRMPFLRDLRVHPDGRKVVFASGQTRGELWVMENFLPAAARPSGAPAPRTRRAP